MRRKLFFLKLEIYSPQARKRQAAEAECPRGFHLGDAKGALCFGLGYFAVANFGYWNTSDDALGGKIAATCASTLTECITRPMLTGATSPRTSFAGIAFLSAKEGCYWCGIGLATRHARESNAITALAMQFLFGGVLANFADVLAGRAMANAWSARDSIRWACESKREYFNAYARSCPHRVIAAVGIPAAVIVANTP